ncbi:MAG: sensor histidine kinase [Lachnospiraceae bacterium]|nr:sensor histidine kinase [Lachnospiraceae bacterium]
MIQKIRNSLLLQMVGIIFAILAVLAVTLFASFLYVRNTTRTSVETLADSLLKQADNALGQYRENLSHTAESLSRFLSEDDMRSSHDSNWKPQFLSHYNRVALENREIISTVLFDCDMQVIMSMGKHPTLPERQIYLRTGEALNADRYYADSDKYYYAFYYPIYKRTDGEPVQLGMCMFILEPWRIDGALQNILNNNAAAMLLSDSHKLDLSFRSFGNVPDGATMDDLKQNPDYVYREGTWQNGIRIAVAVSVSGNTTGSRLIMRLIVVAAVLTTFFLAVVVFFSYFRMVKPIRSIDRFIDNMIKHPDRRLNLVRTDEIGTVAASLDHMLDENRRMIEEIKDGKIRLYETELAQQKMEILAYRNQINPHFLYNTLSCMRDMALINDQDNIAEMAMALSDIFRYAVKASNIVAVRDEVSYIEKYAKIIEYRFMGKIRIILDVAEEVLDKPIIRFFLQPLVENAVFHGLESKMDPGSVHVTARMGEERIEFAVEDDGVGMDEGTLNRLREQLRDPKEDSSVGLSNIVARLRLFYDNDYSFEANSTVSVGTVMRISVPDHMIER